MKTRKEIEETLKKYKPLLREKFKVKEIGIFGSYARGEESDQSDVDLLVAFDETIGWEFIDLKDFLERVLDKPVDLVTVNALKPHLRGGILKEVVYP